MSDQEIFTYGKNYVSALIAKITYDDYLPLLLSEKHNLGRYRGYEPETNPSVSNIFSTSAFRFGHFTAPENVLKMNNNGKIL